MAPLDPLYQVWCEHCGHAYLGRVDDLVDIEGRCLHCRQPDIHVGRVPDEEDLAGPWRLLSMDALEHSARLALRSARLRNHSDTLIRYATDVFAARLR